MPANVVRTAHEEKMWKRAKLIVDSSLAKGKLKNVEKGSVRYYKLVMGTYKALKSGRIKM